MEKVKLQDKIDGIVSIIFKASGYAGNHFLKNEKSNDIRLYVFSQIFVEATLFLLYFCDREIFTLVCHQERDAMLSGVLEKISKTLETHDDKLLKIMYGEQSVENLGKYFGYLSNASFSTNFMEAYGEFQIKYGVYKEWFPDDDDSFDGTLVWEFAKKVNSLINEEPNLRTIASFSSLISEMMKGVKEGITEICLLKQ
jgi:hypothetical protein